MDSWSLLGTFVVVLGSALLAGLLARRLGQNSIIGYLFAGILIGPSVLNAVRSSQHLRDLSELGVALLMFSVGLEFSLVRLRQTGPVAVLGGVAQILATAAVAGLLAAVATSPREAAVIGLAVAMSSTAVVIRVLAERTELDSAHGRNAVGILLLQDLAVVPVIVITEALGERSSIAATVAGLGVKALWGGALAAGLVALTRFLVPLLLRKAPAGGYRDMAIVLTVTCSLGATWGAHAAGLTPTLGAFLAGMLLAESPFATQVRADITPLSASFVTLFFASVGTLVEIPGLRALAMALAAALVVMTLKTAIVATIVWRFQRSLQSAVVSGLVLCQVGEFTFVVAGVGWRAGIISAENFQTLLASSVISLLLTPYLIAMAPGLAARLRRAIPAGLRRRVDKPSRPATENKVVVIGLGPAGIEVVERLRRSRIPFLVIDQNPERAASPRSGVPLLFGDATQWEILDHAGVADAKAVVCTIPDPKTAGLVVAQVRHAAGSVPVIARARYHLYAEEIRQAGAAVVVDEEQLVGQRLAGELMRLIEDGS
ncbi:MAG: cation:proton antiporter [Bryobacteraceae bacterium]